LRLDCFLHKINNELSYDIKNILEINPAETFSEQTSLEKILITHNENLQYIHLNSFKNLSLLMELDLSQNRIGSIDEYLFNDLKSLKRLNLNNNKVINCYY